MSRGPQGEEDESASTTKAVIFAALDDICLWDCLYALSYDNRQVTLVIHVVSIYWMDAAGTCALIWYRQEDQNLCKCLLNLLFVYLNGSIFCQHLDGEAIEIS